MTDLRIVDTLKMMAAVNALFTRAGQELARERHAAAYANLTILDALPIGRAEILNGIGRRIFRDVYTHCRDPKIRRIAGTIHDRWLATWRTGGACDPVTLVPTLPLREGGFAVGDTILIAMKVPHGCPFGPGMVATVVRVNSDFTVDIQNDSIVRTKMRNNLCIPCRGPVAVAHKLRLTHWASANDIGNEAPTS